jgi:hypothetical protein
MTQVTTEQIFAQLFVVAQTLKGKDWAGNPIPFQYATRNWSKVPDNPDALMPSLYQLDPREENDVRTGLGRSRRKLHAQLEIRFQRQQPEQYPDTVQVVGGQTIGPFSTLMNNWIDNLYGLFSPADGGPQTLAIVTPGMPVVNLVADCYPISCKPDYGNDQSRVAIVYTIIELILGG